MIDLLDTHQHLLYRAHFRYDWSDALPALAGQDFTLEDYRDFTSGESVAGTIFMEVDADDYREEARFVSKLVRDPSTRIIGIIASCRPELSPEQFEEWLEECADLPVVGLRRILHESPDALSQTDQFRRNLSRLGSRNLVFDLCVRADQLTVGVELIRSCPETFFVLDHCGVPDIAGGAWDGWQSGINSIAKLSNVACKISGIMAYCAPDSSDAATIRPYVAHVIDAFGPDRLLWGSDWPVVNTRSSLPDWIETFRVLISDLSEGEQRAICSGTAQRVYGVSIAGPAH